MKKEKTIIIRIEENLFVKYKEICKINGYNMSQRLRNFIENEIKNNYYDTRREEEKVI